MSDAPERIWVDDERAQGGGVHVWATLEEHARQYATEYVRADLLPTLSAALVDAVMPFYAAVFNDNGDVTIDTGHLTTSDWLKLDRAVRAAAKEAGHE